jgi:UDP-N-acetylmuramate--alanine ligase
MDWTDLESQGVAQSDSATEARLVGGGYRMAALGRWLASKGYDVSRASISLRNDLRREARVDPGHHPVSSPWRAMRLFYGPGTPRQDPERLSALRNGVAETPVIDVLRGILADGVGIAVAGRRNGRVAAAMIGWTLTRAGLDPTILLRDDAPQLGGPARIGSGPHAVVDLEESLEVVLGGPPGPAIALILDLPAVDRVDTIGRLAACVGPLGHVIAASAPLELESLMKGHRACVETLSLERGSTWWGADLREDRGRFRFRAFHRGRFAAEIRLNVPGRASVLSALAAMAVCRHVDVPTREIQDALEDFAGVSRGFESRGSYRGVTLLDDDAVEAPDVADALEIARAVHGRRRLWAVFAPGGPPRAEFATALLRADRVMLVDASVDARPWSSMLGESGVDSRSVADSDEALRDLDRHLEPGDVLLTLGAGDVGTIADAFLRRLPRDRQGR